MGFVFRQSLALSFCERKKRVLLENKWLIKQCKESGEDHFIVKNRKFKEQHHVRTKTAVSNGSSHGTIWKMISGGWKMFNGGSIPSSSRSSELFFGSSEAN